MTLDTEDRSRAAGRSWEVWYGGLHRASADAARRARVVRAKHYIDRQFAKSVPLDAMAAEARLSKYHFVRAFRDIFSQTPHRYLVARRIVRARELLERTDRSVTEICFEVGFESLGSFVSRFRQLVGHPPARYRRLFAKHGSVHERAIPACLYEAFSRRPPATDRNSREAPPVERD
jgi:AraC-like DNA-binding protein